MALNPEKSNKSRVKLTDMGDQSIYSNHLNNSVSKMQYSISKSPRFKETKKYISIHQETSISHNSTSFLLCVRIVRPHLGLETRSISASFLVTTLLQILIKSEASSSPRKTRESGLVWGEK